MVVSFSLGEKSKKIINTLKKTADNVDFYPYDSVKDLVKDANLRHLDFKRIVLSTSILKDVEKDLNLLNDFIKNHSASTEIVLVVMSADGGADKVFNSIFNSPMYTPVILPKATSKNLLELVLSTILELKTKYYTFDVVKEQSAEGTSSEDIKNTPSLPENENTQGVVSSGGQKVDCMQTENTSHSEVNSGGVFAGFGGSSTINTEVSLNKGMEESTQNSDGLGLVGSTDLTPSENDVDLEEDLSIGEYGSQHSDTGFLDEEDEKELQAYMEKNNEVEISSKKTVIISKENEKQTPKENQLEKGIVISTEEAVEIEKDVDIVKKEYEKLETRNLPNIDLVTYVRGINATKSIIDEALNIYKSDNANVLIIDLDIKNNRILSFINTKDFYNKNCQEGISKQRVFSEGGINFVSNGYGNKVSSKTLKGFLSSTVPTKFDMIFIDCPVDCLSILDKELIEMLNILIISGGDKDSLISTSKSLTDRDVLSLDVERHIMDRCMVEIKGTLDNKAIDYLKDFCLFANGNWLTRIGK